MDIVITLPAKESWENYEKELEKVKKCKEVMNFKVPNKPNVKAMDKCYIVHKGYIRGFMLISGVITRKFVCSTTEKEWDGIFVQRCGYFYPLEKPVKMKGFQGYRYVDNLKEEIKQKIMSRGLQKAV